MTGSKRTLWAFQFQAWYSNLHLFTCMFQELYDSEQERHVAQSTASECLRPWQIFAKNEICSEYDFWHFDKIRVAYQKRLQNDQKITSVWEDQAFSVILQRIVDYLLEVLLLNAYLKCHLLEERKKQDIKLLFFCRLVPYCQNRVKRRKWRFLITLRLQRITEEGWS